eukprot:1884538-Amphidinium_carterae.1
MPKVLSMDGYDTLLQQTSAQESLTTLHTTAEEHIQNLSTRKRHGKLHLKQEAYPSLLPLVAALTIGKQAEPSAGQRTTITLSWDDVHVLLESISCWEIQSRGEVPMPNDREGSCQLQATSSIVVNLATSLRIVTVAAIEPFAVGLLLSLPCWGCRRLREDVINLILPGSLQGYTRSIR